MEIWLAEAPPLKREASNLPIWTWRFSAAESFFSRSGRKLSTLMNKGTSTTISSRTATTIPEMTNRRFMQKCYHQSPMDGLSSRPAGWSMGERLGSVLKTDLGSDHELERL